MPIAFGNYYKENQSAITRRERRWYDQTSPHTTEDSNNQEVPELPCPACIEATSKIIEGKELVPEYALRRYTFDQLVTHLAGNKHNRKEFIDVALRASMFLYSHAFAHAYEKIEEV